MPVWLIAIIILAVIVSRAVKALRRMQEEVQKQRPGSEPTRVRAPWEFEPVEETPEEDTRHETRDGRSEVVGTRHAVSPQSQVSSLESFVDESTGPDEEAFKEETVAQTQPPEGRGTAPRASTKPSAPPRRKPVQIAGTPLTPQTIRHGIIISEILRRPEF